MRQSRKTAARELLRTTASLAKEMQIDQEKAFCLLLVSEFVNVANRQATALETIAKRLGK